MNFKIALLLFCTNLTTLSFQAQEKFHHMLGYVDMREACIWVQSASPRKVVVQLHKKVEPKTIISYSQETSGEYTSVAHVVLKNLEPGTLYEYTIGSERQLAVDPSNAQLYSFTTQPLWQYRTDPPEFTIATGSCAFINETAYDRPGEPYGGDYGIFQQLAAKKPNAMLWLGDNVYLREVDFASKTGIYHRYELCRFLPELQNLMHNVANYAIWDDHDFGPNDSDGSFIHKDWTLEAFRTYWANPSYGLPGECKDNGITTQFSWGDIDFFLLDNRFFRVTHDLKNGATPTILGESQINWLVAALKFSKSPFKIVTMGGQFLSTNKIYENYANWGNERQRILDAIEANHITGVVFLSGDRHCGELSELKQSSGNVIYDLTVSPLTSKAYDMSNEKNDLRVAGTIVPERHFATLGFSGVKGKRLMTITVFDASGNLIYDKKIYQQEK